MIISANAAPECRESEWQLFVTPIVGEPQIHLGTPARGSPSALKSRARLMKTIKQEASYLALLPDPIESVP